MVYSEADLKKDIDLFVKGRFEKLGMEMLQKGQVKPEVYLCYWFPQYLKFRAFELPLAAQLIGEGQTPAVREMIQIYYNKYKKKIMPQGGPPISAVIVMSDMFIAQIDEKEAKEDWRTIKAPSQRIDRKQAIAFYISIRNKNAIFYYFYNRNTGFITFDLKNPVVADYETSVVEGGHLQNLFPK